MKIIVYKGFAKDFYKELDITPLIECEIEDKFDLEKISNIDYVNKLIGAIFASNDESVAFVTYEEYTAIYDTLMSSIFHKHTIEVVLNNIFPEIYPLEANIDKDDFDKYQQVRDSEKDLFAQNKKINYLLKFYTDIFYINGRYYATYHNKEIRNGHVEIVDYYDNKLVDIEISQEDGYDYIFDISDKVERYIECYDEIIEQGYKAVAYRDIEQTNFTKISVECLRAFCKKQGVQLYKLTNEQNNHVKVRPELLEITKHIIGENFNGFKTFDVYKNPRMNNQTEPVSQGDVMEYIAREAENAAEGKAYRDIFFTAPTGAGKSITFQVPALYIAEKYKKLVIIIEPLKGLMKDQVDNLQKKYGNTVDFINSDIAIPADRDRIIEGVKNGRINILYVSPETLISRTIESLVGDREIGLLIVDEAHIVTAWGMGFRPDYWYLGSYINRLRSERTGRGTYDKNRKFDRFPIFACTATAVNGGWDDTVSETFISLTMNDPIVILGYAKRDKDIKFDINVDLNNYTKIEYEEKKANSIANYITDWHKNNKKSIIYTPYRSIANNMKNSSNEFLNFEKFNSLTGIYTGGGDDPNQKNEDMEKFKSGEIKTIYATKAFGMGVDIKDVDNVYHYAPTGSLADYVQEIGRVARKEGMIGYAVTDYYKHDMKYIDALYGMSQITKTHIMQCLRVIYDAYKQKGRRQRFVVAPSMFESVFITSRTSNENRDIEAKLKIALLMIEKDLRNTYRTPVFISRPGTVFTNCYVRVAGPRVSDVISSKYGQYFIEKTKFQEGLNKYTIYEVKLSEIWENKLFNYDKMSFPAFKYHFYNRNNETENKIMPEISDYFSPQIFLRLESKKCNVSELYDLAKKHIDFIVTQLNSFGGRYFTIDEFSKKIARGSNSINFNKLQADSIASSFFSVVDLYEKCVVSRTNKTSLLVEYNVTNGNIRNLAEAVLDQSQLIRNMLNHMLNTYERYMPLDANKDSNALKLLSLFDLISYNVEGGNEPQISIWLNSPERIGQIVEGRIQYNNEYVRNAFEKHKRSVRILRHFFENLTTDDARWNFIERYFLGEDVMSEIKQVSTDEEIVTKPLSSYIVPGTGIEISVMYKDWDELIDAESRNSEKYLFAYKQMIKAGIRMADKASVDIKMGPRLSDEKLTPLFIYENENVVILSEYAKKSEWDFCHKMGWRAFSIDELEDEAENLSRILNG